MQLFTSQALLTSLIWADTTTELTLISGTEVLPTPWIQAENSWVKVLKSILLYHLSKRLLVYGLKICKTG